MILTLWVVSAVGGAMALSRYNRAGTGLLLGLILGPIGVLGALLMRSNLATDEQRRAAQAAQAKWRAVQDDPPERDERDCPFCAERILVRAIVCKHCGRSIPPPEPTVSGA